VATKTGTSILHEANSVTGDGAGRRRPRIDRRSALSCDGRTRAVGHGRGDRAWSGRGRPPCGRLHPRLSLPGVAERKWYVPSYEPAAPPFLGEPQPGTLSSPFVYGPAFSALAHLVNVALGNEAMDEISTAAEAYQVRHVVVACSGSPQSPAPVRRCAANAGPPRGYLGRGRPAGDPRVGGAVDVQTAPTSRTASRRCRADSPLPLQLRLLQPPRRLGGVQAAGRPTSCRQLSGGISQGSAIGHAPLRLWPDYPGLADDGDVPYPQTESCSHRPFGDELGEDATTTPRASELWVVGRARAGNHPPHYCREDDTVTPAPSHQEIVMAHVLQCVPP
jgi:hypothetical protein